MKKFYTEQQTTQARNTNILQYLLSKGEKFIQQGQYYRHGEHSSWVFDDKKKLMHFNKGLSTANGEITTTSNCLTVAMSVYNLPFRQAVEDILEQGMTKDLTQITEQEILHGSEKQAFNYKRDVGRFFHAQEAKDYLVNERKIDERLVERLMERRIIGQDKHANIVFSMLSRPSGLYQSEISIEGVELRGTRLLDTKTQETMGRKYFTQLHPNNAEYAVFNLRMRPNEPVTEVKVFEAPIDALSYMTLYKQEVLGKTEFAKQNNVEFVAMHGLKWMNAVKFYEKVVGMNKELTDDRKLYYPKITLCVDNDEGGRAFAQNFREHLRQIGFGETFLSLKIKEEMPQVENGDYNDVLVAQRKQEEKEQVKQTVAPQVQQETQHKQMEYAR